MGVEIFFENREKEFLLMEFKNQKRKIKFLFYMYIVAICIGIITGIANVINLLEMGFLWKPISVVVSLILFSIGDIKQEVKDRFFEIKQIKRKKLFSAFLSGVSNFSLFLSLTSMVTILISFIIIFLATLMKKLLEIALIYSVVAFPESKDIDVKADTINSNFYVTTKGYIGEKYTYFVEERVTGNGFRYYLFHYGDNENNYFSPFNFTPTNFDELYKMYPQLKKGYAIWAFNPKWPNDIPFVVSENYRYKDSNKPCFMKYCYDYFKEEIQQTCLELICNRAINME